MSEYSPGRVAAERTFPVWAKIVMTVSSVFAGLAWLATWGVYAMATAPSASPSENMNGLVILLLPYTLVPAAALTMTALIVGFTFTRSRTVKTITLTLAVLVTAASCAAGVYYTNITSP